MATMQARARRWSLRVADGNAAHVEYIADDDGTVRVVIDRLASPHPFDVQLNWSPVKVNVNERYRIQFRARADRTRIVRVGFAQAHEPWSGLGWYATLELTPEWRTFEQDITPAADESDARIHFDLGDTADSVEVAALRFRYLSPTGPIDLAVGPPGDRTPTDRVIAPLSYEWGTDRGLPVHRYYLEQFLAEFATDIRGHCLEFQNPAYARRFGGSSVTSLDIVNLDDSSPHATLIADLTQPNDIPSGRFDCIICTHVLQLIPEARLALADMYRILRPGGTLLIAEPHISMAASRYHEMWRYTAEGLEYLLANLFGAANVTVRAYGNSLTAAGEIRGAVAHEFSEAELDAHDAGFAVEVCGRATKPAPPDYGEEIRFWSGVLASSPAATAKGDPREAAFPAYLSTCAEELRRERNVRLQLLEVGSGPVSILAAGVERRLFDVTAVDPLADEYAGLMRDNRLSHPIIPVRGSGETLVRDFGTEHFDIVYSSNALDHTISPRECVQQMCSVLRPGGILFLEGFVRNGTLERWSGLHQHDLVPEETRLIHYDRNGTRADLTADLPLECVHLEVSPFHRRALNAFGYQMPSNVPADAGYQHWDWYTMVWRKA